jgi:hypothetical protein
MPTKPEIATKEIIALPIMRKIASLVLLSSLTKLLDCLLKPTMYFSRTDKPQLIKL